MNTLFDYPPSLPEGFSYHPEFISVDEERELLTRIAQVELKSFFFQGFEAKRKVASFGYDYSFDKGKLSKGRDIPPAFTGIIGKVAAQMNLLPDQFAELLVTEYPVGAVINWHRDAPPFDIIAGISRAGDCIFKLRPYDKKKQGRSSIINVDVKRRSLYIIRGIARSEWQHSTAPVKSLRYSITLRTLV
jgi:alkylated DNA repair dioxygenase AlkB